MKSQLETDGYQLFPAVFTAEEMSQVVAHLGPVERAGKRSLLDDAFVQSVARDARIRRIVGGDAFAVRALLFDKTVESNWGLRWHQDLSIATRERREVEGFEGWTLKAGITHALAPASTLSRMTTLRIHLDDCGAESGPLQVVPRSHLAGRLPEASIPDLVRGAKVCTARQGDVLAFKPLLLHASASAKSLGHRRVLQIEFASEELPGGLTWRWRA
jgi:hypothetical protein